MWVFLSDAFLSIVADRADPSRLLVRGRLEGDIERVFPRATVQETPQADYRFRAYIARGIVARVLVERILEIDYPNFKATLSDRRRILPYHDVWETMRWAQMGAPDDFQLDLGFDA